MTTVLQCTIKGDRLVPLEPQKVEQWKKSHKQGQVFDLILSDEENSALSKAALLYFSIRDDYAAVNGYSKEEARRELEYLHGMTYPDDAPPTGRKVTRYDYHGFRWYLSIKEYSTEELSRLVNGAQKALDEASV